MRKLFLFLSHTLTDDQKTEIDTELNVDAIKPLPNNLNEIWKNIPPEAEDISKILKKFKDYLESNSSIGDYVLVQGDFGMTFTLVSWCLKHGRVPIYSTTRRNGYRQLKDLEGNIVNIHKFKHVRFRTYYNGIR